MRWFKLLSKSSKRNSLIKVTEGGGGRYDLYQLKGSLCSQNIPTTQFFIMTTVSCILLICIPVHII